MGDLSLEKVLLFVLVALPGLVAIRSYSLWLPTPQKDWKDSLIDAVFYSTICFFLWAVLYPSGVEDFVTRLLKTPTAIDTVKAYVPYLFCYTLVTPFLMSLGWYKLRTGHLHYWLGMDHPIRTGWDWIIRNGGAFYIRFVLKRKDEKGNPVELCGYFADGSFAATYPQDPEIYVERLHYVLEDGVVGDGIEHSRGMVIKLSECERVEIMTDPSYFPPTWGDTARRRLAWIVVMRCYSNKAQRRLCVWCWKRSGRYDYRVTRWVGGRFAGYAQWLSNTRLALPPKSEGSSSDGQAREAREEAGQS